MTNQDNQNIFSAYKSCMLNESTYNGGPMKDLNALLDAHATFTTLLHKFSRKELQEIYDKTKDERVMVLLEMYDALYR